MEFGETDPLTARARFGRRSLQNITILVVLFIPLVLILSWITAQLIPGGLGMLLADAVAIGIVYFLYDLWQKTPVGLVCNHCGKVVATNTPWICGYCRTANTATDQHPFVGRCARNECGAEPKGYRCHHPDCGKVIFLTQDRQEANCATCLSSPTAPPDQTERDKRKKEKEDKQHEIEMAEMDEKLKKTRERTEGPKVPSRYENRKKEMMDYYENLVKLRADMRNLEKEAAEQFKNDPDALADALAVIKEIRRRNIQ
jgi:hypothetical protein